jgi:hypothetical protein
MLVGLVLSKGVITMDIQDSNKSEWIGLSLIPSNEGQLSVAKLSWFSTKILSTYNDSQVKNFKLLDDDNTVTQKVVFLFDDDNWLVYEIDVNEDTFAGRIGKYIVALLLERFSPELSNSFA